MLVVVNRVKKGIEVPELNITNLISNIVNIGAIDKVRYADYLALGLFLYMIDIRGVFVSRAYIGDATMIESIDDVSKYGICFEIFEQ